MIVLCLFLAILVSAQFVIPIYTDTDLKNIKSCLSCQYVLMDDIVLASAWAPVGDVNDPFTGTLNGNGKTITFNDIGPTSDGNAGLFGAMLNAKAFNLNLVSATSLTEVSTVFTLSFGILAGSATGVTIYGCSASLSGGISIVDGVLTIGAMVGTIRNSAITRSFVKTSLTVTNIEEVNYGGFFGYAAVTTIESCEAIVGDVITNAITAYVGGILGVTDGSTISQCRIFGTLTSSAKTHKESFGGCIGLTAPGTRNTSITDTMVNTSLISTASTNTTMGGIIGITSAPLTIRNCDVILDANGANSETTASGYIGKATTSAFTIDTCRANVTILLKIDTTSPEVQYASGIVGFTNASAAVISNSVAFVNISATAPILFVGGLVGSGIGLSILNSGAVGVILSTPTAAVSVNTGGLTGTTLRANITQCYFIGNVTIGPNQGVAAGALIGRSERSNVTSCYTMANMSSPGSVTFIGAFGNIIGTPIVACYASVNISANATIFLAMGGMLGIVGRRSPVRDSFAISNLTTSSQSGGSVGGFVGFISAATGGESITGCYAWGTISANSESLTKFVVGGFAGSLLGTSEVLDTIAYVNITSPSLLTKVGIFAGLANKGSSSSKPGFVEYFVGYVAPGGVLTNIGMIGDNSSIPTPNVYCANYPNTVGCTEISTLNTEEFLKKLDNISFQISTSLANGSISLLSLPAPATGSTTGAPRIVLPSGTPASTWSSDNWIINEKILLGMPFLKTINYNLYCSWATGCYGTGLSPLDATCSSGWSSPPQNTTALVYNLQRCNIFACKADSDCSNGGSCNSGKCTCASGYTGPNCGVLICPTSGDKVCGGNTCKPFSDVASTGICQCAALEVLTAQGACVQGCKSGGFGICQAVDSFLCFEGYSVASNCLEYDCSMVKTNVCNGKGTCTNKQCSCTTGSLLGGNCHTICSSDVTKNCYTLNCGSGNSCSSHGQCVPSPSDMSTSCICNIDAAGNPVQTNYTGQFCNECMAGLSMVNGDCYKNNCLQCEGGKCTPNAADKTIACVCPEGHSLANGVCFIDLCGDCSKGNCVDVQNTPTPNARYCVCNSGVSDMSCYVVNCNGCKNGVCTPDSGTMMIGCVCDEGFVLNTASGNCEPPNKSNSVVAIVLPIIFVGGAAIAVGVTLYILFKKRILKVRMTKKTRVLMPSGNDVLTQSFSNQL